MSVISFSTAADLQTAFQREINRCADSDRNTRKRGMQKLLEDIPWASSSGPKATEETRRALGEFLRSSVIELVARSIPDAVEKCRECALKILLNTLTNSCSAALTQNESGSPIGFVDDFAVSIARALSDRLGDIPFPETVEELRLLVLQSIHVLVAQRLDHNPMLRREVVSVVIMSLGRALHDQFPASKVQAAETIALIASDAVDPLSIRLHYRHVLKGLAQNAFHQHAKVRTTTLKALAAVLLCVSDDFEASMKEVVLPLLIRLEADRSATTRRELATLCGTVLCGRARAYFDNYCSASSSTDINADTATPGPVSYWSPGGPELDILAILFSLDADDNEDVRKECSEWINRLGAVWCAQRWVSMGGTDANMFVDADIYDCGLRNSKLNNDGAMEISDAVSGLGGAEAVLYAESNAAAAGGTMFLSNNLCAEYNSRLQSALATTGAATTTSTVTSPVFVRAIALVLFDAFLVRTQAWTSDAKIRSLRSIASFLNRLREGGADSRVLGAVQNSAAILERVMPSLISVLGPAVCHEDADVRQAARSASKALGALLLLLQCASSSSSSSSTTTTSSSSGDANQDRATSNTAPFGICEMLDLVLPRIAGEAFSGGDTAQQRALAVALLSNVLEGTLSDTGSSAAVGLPSWLPRVARAIGSLDLHEYRELHLREALLLLTRTVIAIMGAAAAAASNTIAAADATSVFVNLSTGLLFLSGRCALESDPVPKLARAELARVGDLFLAGGSTSSGNNVAALLAAHFVPLLSALVSPTQATGAASVPVYADWTSSSPRKAAFEILIRECPAAAWEHHDLVLPVTTVLTAPRAPKHAEGSTEANTAHYAAVSGEEVVIAQVDVRVSSLALLEGWLRAGAADWTVAKHLNVAASAIISNILLPNLVWKSGRVEAAARQVALLCLHALLFAGAVDREVLFNSARELVPIVVGNLDDSDASTRHICVFILNVLFTRLRGAFAEQAIYEMYPKLLKRLDDSSDAIRADVCKTLCAFFTCSEPSYYSSTTIDYSLEQLFVHLDDPNEKIQEAVLEVILYIKAYSEAAVLKRAASSRATHRTGHMCDRVIALEALKPK